MSNMLNTILENIDTATAIVTALSALVILLVREYVKIRKIIATKGALDELNKIIAPYSAEAVKSPATVLSGLTQKPVDGSKLDLTKKENKAIIVAQASYEQAVSEKPTILKKLGIDSAADVLPFVDVLYKSIIKPIAKKM